MWREPDEIIGEEGKIYLLRWWLFVTRCLRCYLHKFLNDDDDRALHDHPAWSVSIPFGNHFELIRLENGSTFMRKNKRFIPIFRKATHTHRIILARDKDRKPIPFYTIFFFGPKSREWGFWCPKGWRHWRVFCDERDSGKVGKGCS